MVYEILNVVEIPTVVDPDTEFSREKTIIVTLAWGHCCVILPIILQNKCED